MVHPGRTDCTRGRGGRRVAGEVRFRTRLCGLVIQYRRRPQRLHYMYHIRAHRAR